MNAIQGPPLLRVRNGVGPTQFGPWDVAGWEALIVTFAAGYPTAGGNTAKRVQLDWFAEGLPINGAPGFVQICEQTWDITSPGIGTIAFPVLAPFVQVIVDFFGANTDPWKLLDIVPTMRKFDSVRSLGINSSFIGGEDRILESAGGFIVPTVFPAGLTTHTLPPYVGPATVFFQASTGAYSVNIDAVDAHGIFVPVRLYGQIFPAAAVDVPPVTIEVPPRIIQVTYNNTSGGNLTIAGSIVANS